MDLTTTTRYHDLILAGAQGTATLQTDVSTAIGQLIAGVSAKAEAYMDRVVLSGSQTIYLDVDEGQRVWSLPAFPVTAIAGVYFDPLQSFANALDSSLYLNPVLDTRGLFETRFDLNPIYLRRGILRKSLKVTYTGGMAATTSAFIAAYPDITAAIDMQVRHEWVRRLEPGTASMTMNGTALTFETGEWLPSVKAVLDDHRRHFAA